MEEILKNITVDYLKSTPIGKTAEHAAELIGRFLNAILNEGAIPDNAETSLRAATAVMITMLKKAGKGTVPKEYSADDWADLAEGAGCLVSMDGQIYSELVFSIYASAMEKTAGILSNIADGEKLKAILKIAGEIRKKNALLENGKIGESTYTEDCLWLCGEAVIKIMNVFVSLSLKGEYAELCENVSMLVFEYSRLALYQKEIKLIDLCFFEQKELDAELEERYGKYLAELKNRADSLLLLIGDAFSQDLDTRFRASIELAEQTGVARDDILDSKEKIDSFFMA